ncbi:MAG: cytoplasmic protein [Desulfobacterales bacterium]
MPKYSHTFVEEYNGLVGFGLDRKTDEASFVVYLQKFSDDRLMAALKGRLTKPEIEEMVDLIHRLMRNHFCEEEYHRLFLKEDS